MKIDYCSLIGKAEGAGKIHVHLSNQTRDDEGDGFHTHSHAAEEAVYVLEGEAEHQVADRRHRVGPGQTVFFPSGVQHGQTALFSDAYRYLVIRSVEPSDEPCCCEQDR